MIGAERPRLVPTQWFRPGSPRLVLVTRQSSVRVATLRSQYALRDPWFELVSREPEGLGIGVLMHVPYSLDQIGYSKAFS